MPGQSVIKPRPLMDQIEPYRQIVELQEQIVRISRWNSELRQKCEDLENELASDLEERQFRARIKRRQNQPAQSAWRLFIRIWKSLKSLRILTGMRV
jgi:hypothetical protein